MDRLQRSASWLALALLVLTGGELLVIYAERWFGIHQYYDVTALQLAAIAASRDAADLCLALFGAFAILHAPLRAIGMRMPKSTDMVWGLALGLATAFISPRLVQLLHLQNSYNLTYSFYIMSHANGMTAVAIVFVVILLSPIVEELVFRGIVMEGFLSLANGPVAIVGSAVIFAGFHAAGGAAQMVTTLFGGIVFGWLYLRTRSIAATSVAHIVNNALAVYPVILVMLRATHA